MEWAIRMTGLQSMRDRMELSYDKKIAEARGVDGQEGIPPVLEASEWVDSRWKGLGDLTGST
jgi:hypothetical protein